MTRLPGTERQCQDLLGEQQREKTLRKQQTVAETVSMPRHKSLSKSSTSSDCHRMPLLGAGKGEGLQKVFLQLLPSSPMNSVTSVACSLLFADAVNKGLQGCSGNKNVMLEDKRFAVTSVSGGRYLAKFFT